MFFLYGTKGWGKDKERYFLGSGTDFEEAKKGCIDAIEKYGYDISYVKTLGAMVVYFQQALDDPALSDPAKYEPLTCMHLDYNPTLH